MKIASWNVNSLKVRLPQLLNWLAAEQADIICLQETKQEDHHFPQKEIEAAGFHVIFAGQKTYNGVALLSRHEISAPLVGNPFFADPQQRLISGTTNGMRVICAYVPNGESLESEKFTYKLAWLAALQKWLTDELATYPKLVIAGDFNIAPEDRDVHDPKEWIGQILCSDAERQAFQNILALGLKDSFRLVKQADKTFSQWDYRRLCFQRNAGVRIDHVLLSTPLAEQCQAAGIDRMMRKEERPSDHAPVWARLARE